MELSVLNQTIALTRDDTLVRNSKKNYTAKFIFDATWSGFTKTANFQAASILSSVVLEDDQCVIPTECLKNAGAMLKVSVSGIKDGSVKSTPWCLTSRILYDADINVPVSPSPSPSPEGEIGRLCGDFADVLSNEYSEEELVNKTLSEIMVQLEQEYVPTATDREVENILNDVWGSEDP